MKTFKYSLSALTLGIVTLFTTACTPINSDMSVANSNITTTRIVENLNYITNIQNPEDLVQIPNTKWLIASGMTYNSGLYLVDSETKTAKRLIAPKAIAPSAKFPNSEPQPHADEMQIHGISIREVGKDKFYLYAVNHNGFDKKITRETIEIFEIDNTTAEPVLTWLGNVRMPKDTIGRDYVGNAVVSGVDSSIYVTVMMHPEHNLDDMFAGKTTGAIYRWTPTTSKFEKLQGTELNGNNGIELSKDEKFIYVAHMQGLSKFTNTNPAKKVATTHLDYGVADNLHWAGNELITAGSMVKTCDKGLTFDCLKDFHVTKINPDNLTLNPVFKGKYNQEFSGVSTVLAVGNTYYLGSFYRDKMAYFEEK
ncbi:hypothetical protein PTQ27_00360 [Mannheimia sp. AT1]|uniref:Gluconolactonase n=1 Tax=Mannheimia cairinae TaxID=3025936 RepID=A0ABT5ML58_9PAST|nr:hypothetical protein [Mannheimia cairinae]MDD0822930.1 hypothetical protein [Mannheimia cairinae]MDD0826042.1 hypothetical protein [Mannheimia cairinae]